MNELIEDYQRKISSVKELLKNKDNDEETITRLKIKVGCYRSFLTDLKRALNIDLVSHCYYQVVYNSYDDNIEEVTSPLPTLERAKKSLEANRAYFDEDMYIIAKINCG